MLTSGVASWTNLYGKTMVELMRATATDKSVQIALMTTAFAVLALVSDVMQLKCMAMMMAAFEAVLIIPMYQCLFVINLILEGVCCVCVCCIVVLVCVYV